VGEDQRPGRDQASTDQTTGRKLSVTEAAEALGISGDAVRSRIKRSTLPTIREGGRVFVVLGDADRPTAQAQSTPQPGEDRLYEEMAARIRYLEGQVEEEREARRRADTLLARLMDRLPELEAPSETPGGTETAAPGAERVGPRTGAAQRPAEGVEHEAGTLREWSGDIDRRPQEGERRPWWRRMFGG
jgi:hypothetical protein